MYCWSIVPASEDYDYLESSEDHMIPSDGPIEPYEGYH